MRYLMKQKLFSWGDDFLIKDENGRDVFTAGMYFSLMGKLSALAISFPSKTWQAMN